MKKHQATHDLEAVGDLKEEVFGIGENHEIKPSILECNNVNNDEDVDDIGDYKNENEEIVGLDLSCITSDHDKSFRSPGSLIIRIKVNQRASPSCQDDHHCTFQGSASFDSSCASKDISLSNHSPIRSTPKLEYEKNSGTAISESLNCSKHNNSEHNSQPLIPFQRFRLSSTERSKNNFTNLSQVRKSFSVKNEVVDAKQADKTVGIKSESDAKIIPEVRRRGRPPFLRPPGEMGQKNASGESGSSSGMSSAPKSFNCIECNRAYSTLGNLKQHMTIHSGFKAFQCQVCEKAFNSKVGYRRK